MLFGLIKPKLSEGEMAKLNAMMPDQLNAELPELEEEKHSPRLTTREMVTNVLLMPLSIGTMIGIPTGTTFAKSLFAKYATKTYMHDLPSSEKVMQGLIEQPTGRGMDVLRNDGIEKAFKDPKMIQEDTALFLNKLKDSHSRIGIAGAIIGGVTFAIPELMLSISSDKKDHTSLAEQKISYVNRLLASRKQDTPSELTSATPAAEHDTSFAMIKLVPPHGKYGAPTMYVIPHQQSVKWGNTMISGDEYIQKQADIYNVTNTVHDAALYPLPSELQGMQIPEGIKILKLQGNALSHTSVDNMAKTALQISNSSFSPRHNQKITMEDLESGVNVSQFQLSTILAGATPTSLLTRMGRAV